MNVLIVYESTYGNTHLVADRIAEGSRSSADVSVVPIAGVTAEQLESADLLVVGGPTHLHGMTSARSRRVAAEAAAKPGSTLVIDPDAGCPGLKEWLEGLSDGHGRLAAAFDTRMPGPSFFTGRASRGISRRLRRRHYRLIARPVSFLVGRDNHLLDETEPAALEWGRALATSVASSAAGANAALRR